MPHKCKRSELAWEHEPYCRGDTVTFLGACPVCGKEWEQVFTEADGLWDVEVGEYNYSMN